MNLPTYLYTTMLDTKISETYDALYLNDDA